jgi:hypothetical protein
MHSPPTSPPRKTGVNPQFDLAGASRVTGGVLRGRAQGNVFNFADADEVMQQGLGPKVGKVQVYTSHADPIVAKPYMVFKHEVTHKLTPVLKTLGRKYSPVRREFLFCHV